MQQPVPQSSARNSDGGDNTTGQGESRKLAMTIFPSLTETVGAFQEIEWRDLGKHFAAESPLRFEDKADVPLISMTRYDPSNVRRSNENVTAVSALVYDIDNASGEITRVSDHAENLVGYAYCHYTTWNSTEAHPRERLVVPLSRDIEPHEFPAAWAGFLNGVLNDPLLADSSARALSTAFHVPADRPNFVAGFHEGSLIDADQLIEEGWRHLEAGYRNDGIAGSITGKEWVPPETIAELRSALEAIDPDESYAVWLKGLASLSSIEKVDEAFRLADTWSQRGPKYHLADPHTGLAGKALIRHKFESFRRLGGASYRSIFHLAQERGWVNPLANKVVVPSERLFALRDRKRALEPLMWQMEDVYEAGLLYGVVGPPKGGKSVLVLDQSICIATGRTWREKRTVQGAVFILAGEGHAAIDRRIRAWELFHNCDLPDDCPLFVSKRACQIIARAEYLGNEVEMMISEFHVKPHLVVIDTLARNFGGDENSTEAMCDFVAKLDEHIRLRFNVTVVVVHHSPLVDAQRARGSTAFTAAVDGLYLVSKDTGIVRWHWGDMKDAGSEDDLCFHLFGQSVGILDNFGNDVTAVVACPAVSLDGIALPTGSNQLLAMKLLRDIYGEKKRNLMDAGIDDIPTVDMNEWGAAFRKTLRNEGRPQKSAADAWTAIEKAVRDPSCKWVVLDQGTWAHPPELAAEYLQYEI